MRPTLQAVQEMALQEMLSSLLPWRAGVGPVFGGCKRCTRAALIAALCAWGITLGLALVAPIPLLVAAAALIALALSALYVAHRIGAASHGTLASLLRQFGASAGEAREIVAALRLRRDAGDSSGVRLRDGEALNVRQGERPGGQGLRLTRITVADAEGHVVAAARLMPDGRYGPLDLADVEADTAS